MSIKSKKTTKENSKKRNLVVCSAALAALVIAMSFYEESYELYKIGSNITYEKVDSETYLLNQIEETLIDAYKNRAVKTPKDLQIEIEKMIETYEKNNVIQSDYMEMMFVKIRMRLSLDIDSGKNIEEIVGRIKACLDEVRIIKEGIVVNPEKLFSL